MAQHGENFIILQEQIAQWPQLKPLIAAIRNKVNFILQFTKSVAP